MSKTALECVFCKIARKEIPSAIVYENKAVLAFLDIAPATPGHTLLIPKNHYRNFTDIPSQTAKKLFEAVRKVSRSVLQATKAAGFNLLVNQGREAGQVIQHAHLHIVPRKTGDKLLLASWTPGKYKPGELERLCKAIKKVLS